MLNKLMLFCKNRDIQVGIWHGREVMEHNIYYEEMLGEQLVRNENQLFQAMP